MKRLIAFDLDGTLAPSKSAISDRMAKLLVQALNKFKICIISGGKIEQFEHQVLHNLPATPALLRRLHLMPTCGTRYYSYDIKSGGWRRVYAEDFTSPQKKQIVAAIKKATTELGLVEKQTYGPTIEDRGSQITFSALGQNIVADLGDEGVRLKSDWDPDGTKRDKLRQRLSTALPEFEVRTGGGTSVDITRPGIDKAYGMSKLMDILKLSRLDILFIGDRLNEGGNDYPVKAMGIDCLQMDDTTQTAVALEAILSVL